MSEVRVTLTNPRPEIEGVTIELSESEARGLLRVIKAPGSETVAHARIAALEEHGGGLYDLAVYLKRALA